MSQTTHIKITTDPAEAPDPDASSEPTEAAKPQGSAPRPPRTMGRRARHSFDIDLTPAELEKDLSYGRD